MRLRNNFLSASSSSLQDCCDLWRETILERGFLIEMDPVNLDIIRGYYYDKILAEVRITFCFDNNTADIFLSQ